MQNLAVTVNKIGYYLHICHLLNCTQYKTKAVECWKGGKTKRYSTENIKNYFNYTVIQMG